MQTGKKDGRFSNIKKVLPPNINLKGLSDDVQWIEGEVRNKEKERAKRHCKRYQV